jgi:hypothetical protein
MHSWLFSFLVVSVFALASTYGQSLMEDDFKAQALLGKRTRTNQSLLWQFEMLTESLIPF